MGVGWRPLLRGSEGQEDGSPEGPEEQRVRVVREGEEERMRVKEA